MRCLDLLVRVLPFFALAAAQQFQKWQPTYASKFTAILQDHCSVEHTAYQTATDHHTKVQYCESTVSCLLSNTDERTKSILSSANVMLGLIPIILTLIGPTSAECALLASRRPILSFLLALGSPSKNPVKANGYRGPVEEIIKERHGRLRLHQRVSTRWNTLVVIVEILLALGAIANTLTLSLNVANTTVFNPWCVQTFGPVLWVLVSVVIYVLGTVTFFLVIREHFGAEGVQGKLPSIWKRIADERMPCAAQDPRAISWRDESIAFVLLAWITTMITVVHIMFGTLWFSSVLFVSAGDAIEILGRFMASAIICRIILMYELTGMRDKTTFIEDAVEVINLEAQGSMLVRTKGTIIR